MRAAAFSPLLKNIVPGETATPRLIGLMSAAIAIGDDAIIGEVIRAARNHRFPREYAYEIVLQSYLFLGFPRMLGAAEVLHREWPVAEVATAGLELTAEEANAWVARGRSLCETVYGELYDPLKRKVESFAPEIFRWMVLEGYGKVLSRPGLDFALRELSIIAFLIVENRPRQLHSHLRGALNSGTSKEAIRQLIEDLATLAPDGHSAAIEIGRKLGIVK